MGRRRPLESGDGLDLLASAGQAWVAVSADGHIVGWNRGAERLFGWLHDDVVGRRLIELLPRTPADGVDRALRDASENPATLDGRKLVVVARHRLGHEVEVEFTVGMREEDEGPTYHAFVHDVTEARRLGRFVAAQRDVSETLLSRAQLDDLLQEVVLTLCRSLPAEVGVLWRCGPGESWEPQRLVGPDATDERERELLAAASPDPLTESVKTRRAAFRQLVEASRQPYSALWIPVVEGVRTEWVIQVMTPHLHVVEGIALDVITAVGAQVGQAVHQRRAQEQLIAISTQNRRILEASSEGVLGIDADGAVSFANPAAARALALRASDLHGRDAHELLHGDADHDADACRLLEAVRGGRPVPFGDEFFRRGDERVLVECATAPLGSPEGGAVLTFRDVTDRRELEVARLQDLDFLQTLLDSLEEGVLACDADGVLTLFNRAMRELVGRPAVLAGPEQWTELYGIRDPLTDEPMELEQLPLYRALHGERVRAQEAFVTRADGQRRMLTVNARQLVDSEGRRLGAVGTVRDVTDHRSALRRMEAAERLAGVGVWEFDLETRETVWSPGMFRIVGLEPDTVMPGENSWRDRIHPGDIERVTDEFAAAIGSDAQAWEHEYRVYREDGATRWVHAYAEKLRDENGAVRRLRGTMHDFTERAEAQAALRRSEAHARQIDRMDSLGQLAGGIAHDFNNLLAVILSYSEFALDALPPEGAARPDVEEIRRAAERAAELTRRLLVFSRGEAVRASLIDLGKLVEDLEPMLERTLGEHLEIVIDVEQGLGRVSADAAQVEQVLVNLALNARDAMPGGGRLGISATKHRVKAADDDRLEPGEYVRVEVCDSGVGMSPEVTAHVFEPFFTTKPKGRGTGLGLATVYGVVKEAGGSIGVRSVPGEGSTFTVLLPTAAEPAANAPAPRAERVAAEAARAERVLVVEDDAMVRTATVRILERAGYEVLSARDAQGAIETLDRLGGDVNLLLSDVVMPGMSGWDLHTGVTRRWPGIPTILMSGHTDDLVGRDALSGDRVEFIAKPFVANMLLAKVHAQLQRQPVARPHSATLPSGASSTQAESPTS